MDQAEPQARGAWLREVVARFEAPLLRYALSLSADPENARDAVQDTLTRLCERESAGRWECESVGEQSRENVGEQSRENVGAQSRENVGAQARENVGTWERGNDEARSEPRPVLSEPRPSLSEPRPSGTGTFPGQPSGSAPADRDLAAWLFTVCRNRLFDLRRKERRMSWLKAAFAAPAGAWAARDPADARADPPASGRAALGRAPGGNGHARLAPPAPAEPSADLERREAAQRVLAALAGLPANQREVVRLKFQEEFSYKQIAQITGLSVSNVGFLLHTALKALRGKLGEGRDRGIEGSRDRGAKAEKRKTGLGS